MLRRHHLADACGIAQQVRRDDARLRERDRVLSANLIEHSGGLVAADQSVRRRRADIRPGPRGKSAVVSEIRAVGRLYPELRRRCRHRDKLAARHGLRRAEKRAVSYALALHDAARGKAQRRIVRRVALHVGIRQSGPVFPDADRNLCRCSGISLCVHRSIAEFILSRARAGRIDDTVVLDLRCAETRPLSQLKQHHIPVCVLCAQRGFGRRAHAGLERDVLYLRLRAGRPGGCCAACKRCEQQQNGQREQQRRRQQSPVFQWDSSFPYSYFHLSLHRSVSFYSLF